jgi:hypothetical protein
MTAAKSTNQAQLKWAERDDKVWVTVNHPSPTDVKTDLTETGLKLSFTARDMPYACEFEFLKEIKTEDTKQSDLSKARMLEFCFFKKEEGEWGKLAKAKAPWIQCDWDKFEDSDDEDAKGGGDFDMSQMMGMGGMGGGMPGLKKIRATSNFNENLISKRVFRSNLFVFHGNFVFRFRYGR